MKLEGSASGPGLKEFEKTWLSLVPLLDSRKLVLDLRGVTFIAPEAMNTLSEIYDQAQPEFQTSTLVAKHIVEAIIHDYNQKRAQKAARKG
ncbi:MAG: hypothetical protein LAP21_06715 [Acidobacteriia bacterium]|nr:hypothetical protein [Terriglobia bacterium]